MSGFQLSRSSFGPEHQRGVLVQQADPHEEPVPLGSFRPFRHGATTSNPFFLAIIIQREYNCRTRRDW